MIESKLNGESRNILEENITKLKELFPEVVTDGKIDFEALKLMLGEEIEGSNERYGFNWKGKNEAIRLAQLPSKLTFADVSAEAITPMAEDMLKSIIMGDEEQLTRSFEILLNNIPNVLHSKIENINEAYYHLLFSSWLQLLGFGLGYEDRSLGGDSDTVLKINDLVVIIEFKYSRTLAIDLMLEKGIKQIKDKDYYKPYQNKKVILVSIATKPKEVKCKIEKLDSKKDKT
ncbi:MAG: PD-(D/E)XK nuclease domain-containing protein [Methanobrevibacter sp.]|jgi:hypothetical protein|nr:PD-(D/E)XK nuclease domain-containing protein [Candidatus Methanovirga aequatorialis]